MFVSNNSGGCSASVRMINNMAMQMTAAGALIFVGAAANADWPAVLNAMPAGTQIAICANGVDAVNDHFKQFLAAVEMDTMVQMNPSDALVQWGMDLNTINRTETIGVAIVGGHWDAELPPILVFLPVNDFTAWATSLDGTTADGLTTVALEGQTWTARPAGKYAVMGIDPEVVKAYVADTTTAARFEQLAGTNGHALIDRCDIWAVVDMNGLGEVVRPGMEQAMAGIHETLANVPQAGMQQQQVEVVMGMYKAIIESVLDEASAVAIGARIDGQGVVGDLAIQWKAGGSLAELYPGTHEPRNLLGTLPDRPFIFAAAGDFKGLKYGELMERMKNMLPAGFMGNDDTAVDASMAMWKQAEGFAMAIYPSPAGLMGGLLNQGVFVIAGPGNKMRSEYKDLMGKMNGAEIQGITYTTEYAEGAEVIDGITVDTYAMQMQFPTEMIEAQKAVAMMYGSAGMRGFVASTDGAMVQTLSRNKLLLGGVIGAVKSEGGDLGANPALGAVDAMMPDDLSMRCYIGLGGISTMVGPMLGLIMQGADLTAFQNLPPIGMGLAVVDGGIHGSFAVPAPIIRAMAEVAQSMQGGPGDDGAAPGDDEEPPQF